MNRENIFSTKYAVCFIRFSDAREIKEFFFHLPRAYFFSTVEKCIGNGENIGIHGMENHFKKISIWEQNFKKIIMFKGKKCFSQSMRYTFCVVPLHWFWKYRSGVFPEHFRNF